jgi:uncharacterized protein (TIGR03437 family)
MPARFSARGRGSKRHWAAAFYTALLRILLFTTAFGTAALAQLAGSITTRNLPQYATGSFAMDVAGNSYFGGAGTSSYPTTAGAAQPSLGGNTDVYLTKVDAFGNTVYATFLGGPYTDSAGAVTVDSAGDLFVAGTAGLSFPTTSNAAIASAGSSTTFAAKLSPDGSHFLYVTYLPPAITVVEGIAVDSQGNAYIAGNTAGQNHAIVVAVSADGSSFLYTKMLAGSQTDNANGITVDGSGDVIVYGMTNSTDFPVTAGAVQSSPGGSYDGFVTKLDGSGTPVFSTYLGGSGRDFVAHVGTDAAGNIYAVGTTTSSDFPTTSNGFQSTPAVPLWSNSPGGFLVSLSPDGRLFGFSTYIPSPDQVGGPYSLAVNTAGDSYLLDRAGAGWAVTLSSPQSCYDGGDDVVLLHFGPGGQLEDATYIGDPHVALPSNNLLPGIGSILLVSTTGGSTGGPAVEQVRFGEPGWTAPACVTPMVLNGATLSSPNGLAAAGEVVSLVGNGIGPAQGVVYQPGLQGQVPRSLGGVQVSFDGIAVPILYAQANQVNAVVPVELSGQQGVTVTLQYQDSTFPSFTQRLSASAPALFRWNPGVSTQAAALNEDATVNGPGNPAKAGSYVSVWGTGFGPLSTPCSDGNLNMDAVDFLAAGYSAAINGDSTIAMEYYGGAPRLLCGVVQLNFQIPAATPPGNFYIVPDAQYSSGGSTTSTQPLVGATIVVK